MYSNLPECPACGSHDLTLLGNLGTIDHFRCDDCGMDCSQPSNLLEDDFDESVEDFL